MDILPSKLCVKCREIKPQDAFGRDKRRPDGLFPYCKRCRLRDPAKRDEVEAKRAAGLRRCPGCEKFVPLASFGRRSAAKDGLNHYCLACLRERAAREDRDRLRERRRKRYHANPEYFADKWRKYYQANSHRLIMRANGQRREADPVKDTLTGGEWVQIIREQGGACARCRQKFSATFIPTRDHIVPLSRGGYLTAENTQALCRRCNTSKGTKTVNYRSTLCR